MTSFRIASGFLKSNILVLLISNAANFLSYIYQFVMGRYLSVEDFGILTAVNSLGIMVGAFLGVIPYVVSRHIIQIKNDSDLVSVFLRKTFFYTLYFLLVIAVLTIVFIDYICLLLNISDSTPVYIFLMYLITGVLLSVFFGAMQGMLMYVEVSIKGALLALFKLIFGVLFVVLIGYSYNGALFASLLANFLVALWVYRIVNEKIPFDGVKNLDLPKGTYKDLALYTVPVALTWLAIGIITNIDVVLIKYYSSEFEAGEYSVAAVISRIAVFLPGVLLSVLFPQVSQNNVDGKSSAEALLTVLGLTVMLSMSFSIFVYFTSDFLIHVLFGAKYIGASDALVIITFAMSVVAVISVIFNFLLAKNLFSYLYATYLIIAVFMFVVMHHMNSSVIDIAMAVLYACLTILLVNILQLIYYFKKEVASKNVVN